MLEKRLCSPDIISAGGEYEICVLCGKTTGVLRSSPVAARKNYVVGCGQLCPFCARDLLLEERDSGRPPYGSFGV